MGAFLFTCPTTKLKVQHWLDDDDDALENELLGLHEAALHQSKNRKAIGGNESLDIDAPVLQRLDGVSQLH